MSDPRVWAARVRRCLCLICAGFASIPSFSCSSSSAPTVGSAGVANLGGGGDDTTGTSGANSGGSDVSGGGSGPAGAGGSAAGSSNTAGTGGSVPVSAVTISSRFPASKAKVCADAPLRLTFSAPVSVGAAGKIQVFKASAPDTPVDSIDIAAASFRDTISGRAFYKVRPIFFEGNDAVVYLHTKALNPGENYFVTIDAGVFVDTSNAPLPAIGGAEAWPFSTVAPAPVLASSLTVSREGEGDFCTVQGAIDFIPAANASPVTVTIKNGTYHEVVYISGKNQIALHGEDRKRTIIAYPNNDALQQKLGTSFRAMVDAEGTTGLVIENLTLHNTTPQGGSQAEALRIEPGDQAILRNADFISLQDTLLLSGRVYVTGSYVEGNVDFIWGKGTAYFENSEIKTVGRAGFLVQSRNGLNYGYVFVDSIFSTDGKAVGTLLGRIEADRFPTSNVAYVNCKFAPFIAPKGWLITNSMGATTSGLDLSGLRFWEYQSVDLDGKPLDVSQRDPASKQLNATDAATLRDKSVVLAGWAPTP